MSFYHYFINNNIFSDLNHQDILPTLEEHNDTLLNEAEDLQLNALNVSLSTFGENSLIIANIYGFLGSLKKI